MTRIDCVRCLKDSNVVIKLLVKHHSIQPEYESDRTDNSPLVIRAEKKQIQRPPPVPPRKFTKKAKINTCMPLPYTNEEPETGETILEIDQLNRTISKTKIKSKDVTQRIRERKFLTELDAPPDAEIYLDLLSEELEYDLRTESESDDTGSTISTVMERHINGNFPEICSISSDSAPSTPTLRQKQIDLSKVLGPYEALEIEFETNNNIQTDECVFNKIALTENIFNEVSKTSKEPLKDMLSPANFQDAHLSYGNENVRTNILEYRENLINKEKDEVVPQEDVNIMNMINKSETPPKPVPRKCYAKKSKTEESEKSDLPRLVNFVPKIVKEVQGDNDQTVKEDYNNDSIIKNNKTEELFEIPTYETGNTYYSLDIITLDNVPNLLEFADNCDDKNVMDDLELDNHFSFWRSSSSRTLSTIGEDEEIENENKTR